MKPADSLEETIARIRQSLADKARAKLEAKLAKAAKSKFETSAEKAAALIAAAIEAERKWEVHSIIMMSHLQTCTCGSTHEGVDGLYLEQKHKDSGSLRWKPLKHLYNLPRVQHRKVLFKEQIHMCPRCFVEQDTLAMLFDTYGPRSRQANLFPELPNQLSSLVVRDSGDDLTNPDILAWLN